MSIVVSVVGRRSAANLELVRISLFCLVPASGWEFRIQKNFAEKTQCCRFVAHESCIARGHWPGSPQEKHSWGFSCYLFDQFVQSIFTSRWLYSLNRHDFMFPFLIPDQYLSIPLFIPDPITVKLKPSSEGILFLYSPND
jgi:hypothetical protein